MSMQISCTGLACARGGRTVFSSLAFQVNAGEALAVTGRNGAGKSSLLRLIAGLLQATEGSVQLHGNPNPDLTLAEQAHYLGHRDALKPSLTVQENIAFWQNFLGSDTSDDGARTSTGLPSKRRSSLDASLAATGLGHAAMLPASVLSAGQRRRLSMARLVAIHRPIWLLDEPVAALDSDGQAMFAGLMSDHLAHGGIVVAATHGPLVIAGGTTARTLQIGAAS